MLVLPTNPAPAVNNPRTRLLATYLIPPTYIPALAVFAPQDFLLELAPPYLAATFGTPSGPITEVQYPAALTTTSIREGLAALQSIVAGDLAPVIFGYSQGAEVLSVYKQAFNAQYATPVPGTIVPTPSYVAIANPDRPNGGLSTRLCFLGVPAGGGTTADAIPTPTETAGVAPPRITTYDFVHQYDFFADFPYRPLNLLALVNAVFGTWEHGTYGQAGPSDAILQQQVGDTAYYLRPTPVLPLLQPLAAIGLPRPLVAALDAPLRVLVEAGYDRTISPGTPTAAQFSPFANPLQTAINFAIAIPTGLDDAIQLMGRGRPFGTTPAGPYGVGGPPVTFPANPPSQLTSSTETQVATTEPPTPVAAKPSANSTPPQRISAVSAQQSMPAVPAVADPAPVLQMKPRSAVQGTPTVGGEHPEHGATAATGSTDTDTPSSSTTAPEKSDGLTRSTEDSSSRADAANKPDSPSAHRSDPDPGGAQDSPASSNATASR